LAKPKKQDGIPFSTLQSDLARGHVAPVYLITGQEAFLAEEAVRAIAETIASGGECARSFYRGDEVQLATVLDDVRALNLFSPGRLTVVSPADDLVKKHRAPLAAYAAAPAAGACLVLVVASTDGRSKLTALVRKARGLVACNRLYERDILAWIDARAKAMGRQIESPATALLAEFLGTDLAALAGELEKLATYIGGRKRISAPDVEAVCLRDRSRQVYDLTDAIGRRQPGNALAMVDRLLEQGGEDRRPLAILFHVSRHMRRLWTARELIGKGGDPGGTAIRLGVHPFFASQFLAQVEAFTGGELAHHCHALLACEARLKSSAVDDLNKRVLLETAMIRLAGRRRQAASPAS